MNTLMKLLDNSGALCFMDEEISNLISIHVHLVESISTHVKVDENYKAIYSIVQSNMTTPTFTECIL